MPALNAKQIEKLLRNGDPGLTNDGQGLYLKISKAGSASWIYRFKLDGRTRDMGLGKYPRVTLETRHTFYAQTGLCLLQ